VGVKVHDGLSKFLTSLEFTGGPGD
jgi:hypothetical protein